MPQRAAAARGRRGSPATDEALERRQPDVLRYCDCPGTGPRDALVPDGRGCASLEPNQEAVCGAERAVGDGRGGGGRARGGGKPGLSGAAWGGGAYGERRRN